MLEHELFCFLLDHGIACPPCRFASNRQEVVEKANAVGFPLVMKIASPDILHKTDAGGVCLGIPNLEAAGVAFDHIIQSVVEKAPEAQRLGVTLCPQIEDGLEVIIGIVRDPSFGPVLMFGLGGIFVEALRDVSFRAIPINETDAAAMIDEIKNREVLDSWRGRGAVNKHSLALLLCQVSRMSELNPHLEELDLNPVRYTRQGWIVLDAKIKFTKTAY